MEVEFELTVTVRNLRLYTKNYMSQKMTHKNRNKREDAQKIDAIAMACL